MRGRSVEILREAGVEVEVLDDPHFENQNEQFAHLMRTGRPFVHVKLATTLDGRIAAAGGDSKWVTGEAAQAAGARASGRGRAPCSSAPAPCGPTTPRSPPAASPRTRRPSPASSSIRASPPAADEPARPHGQRRTPLVVFAGEDGPDGRAEDLRARASRSWPAPTRGRGDGPGLRAGGVGAAGHPGRARRGRRGDGGRFVERGLADKLTLFYAPKLHGSGGGAAHGLPAARPAWRRPCGFGSRMSRRSGRTSR